MPLRFAISTGHVSSDDSGRDGANYPDAHVLIFMTGPRELVWPRGFEPWLCELRDWVGGRPERFELCRADVTEVAVAPVLWGSGPKLL